MSSTDQPLVVIGNPENRRVTMFADAARRLGMSSPRVIAYESLLAAADCDLAGFVPRGALVRIESPGENAVVQAELIRSGAQRLGWDDAQTAAVLKAAAMHGRIAGSDAWYAGYCDLLQRIERELEPLGVRWMNHPSEIPVLFDKTACQRTLSSRDVSIPRILETPTSFDDLQARLDARGWSRVFVKLRYGSSASGVVAFERGPRGMQATTSVELVREGGEVQLFNSLRIARYTSQADIAAIVDELCRQGVHVEQWFPKATFAGRTFDLRVVAIGGEPCHIVMRTSRGPITNLHLGNQRGDVGALFSRWNSTDRAAAGETCRAAAACFSRSHYVGIDLALLTGFARHAILEVNAFGDLLPGVLDADGHDTYMAELASYGAASRSTSSFG